MFVVADAIQVAKRFDAGRVTFFPRFPRAVAARCVFAQVMNDGAGRGEGLRMIVKAKACQLRHTKLFAKDTLAVVALKGPVFEARFDAAGSFQKRSLCGFKELLRAGEQSFTRAEKLQFIAQSFLGARAGKLRGLKLTGGKIDEGQADGRAGRMGRDCGEEIVFANVENAEIGSRARGDDAHDFAANKLLARAGLLHLIADRDLESGAN